MATSRQRGGLRGVYLVAAELSRLGYSVAPTARNAAGADLLVFDPTTTRAASIEVKTNAKRANFWLVGERAKTSGSPSHFYAFLNISTPRVGGEVCYAANWIRFPESSRIIPVQGNHIPV
jgi:hypothetical protein